ncbi:protein FAM183A [Nematolebias whitei]|uniref:protein FAM183A n=1 Tax=Nematolebias whitei TaxID=451745 RepID=UPI001897DCAC|nr:protein FAM183A [Nematolebias whitei]
MSRNKPEDYVKQERFQAEMIEKELRLQTLRTEFTFNPLRKVHILPDKPMSRRAAEVKVDPKILEVYIRAEKEPNKKYPHPMTESQEVGWIPAPLVRKPLHA